jgi:hypothetical protein
MFMKLLFILMALPVLASTCKENKQDNKDALLKGKVIRTSCTGVVVQVLNNDSMGEDGWKDMANNDAQYDNIFAVNNSCKVSAGLKAGTTFSFKADKPTNNDCVYCMMYDGAPKTKYDISDVSIEK